MVKTNKVQLFCSALTVALAMTGCRGRGVQQQTHRQPVQSYGAPMNAPAHDNQMLIPTPDTLPQSMPQSLPLSAPPAQGPALGSRYQNVSPISSRKTNRILGLLPSFKRKSTQNQNTTQLPADGVILTEEQFNALPGNLLPGNVTMPQQQPQQQSAGQWMAPMPETLLPQATQAPHPVQQNQQPAYQHLQIPQQQSVRVPAREVQFNGKMPPVRSASSVRYPTRPTNQAAPQPELIRSFGAKAAPNPGHKGFGATANMNFGGAWGQKVPEMAQMQPQSPNTVYGDPLEIPNIDESYDLWPQAPAETQTVPVSVAAQPAFAMPVTTSATQYSDSMTADSPALMRVTTPSQQSQATLPMIVPAQRNN